MKPAFSDLSPDLLKLIQGGMNPELHWFPEEVPLARLAATMVAMANCEGGVIILGVSPRLGEIVGVTDPSSTVEKIFQAAIQSEPILVLPMPVEVRTQVTGTKKTVTILLIKIPPGLPHVFSHEGKYYARQGSQNTILPANRLYKLLNERGSIQFETSLVPDASLSDLESVDVIRYARSVGKVETDEFTEACEFLVKRGCLKRTDGELHLTYAALLLFGKNPQQWLPNATILAGRFPGSSMSDTFIKQDMGGNLIDQLSGTEEFIRSNLKTVVRMTGLAHRESLEYPFEAVRELLVNAVAHRDYSLLGDNIHLNIFSDHLVVSSPGTLPGPVTLDNLLEARFARNAVITQVLSDLGFVERLGYGLDRVVFTTHHEGQPTPRFEEVAGTFQVTLFSGMPEVSMRAAAPDWSAYASLDLNPRQQIALDYLAARKRITSHDYQELCPGVHAETLRRDLADLVNRGIVIKVGDKKATYYILK